MRPWMTVVGVLLMVGVWTACSDSSNWSDKAISDAAVVWVNQTGLNQSDEGVWSDRLDAICATDPDYTGLAERYVTEDAEHSVRSDGSLPTAEEALDTVLIIRRQTCGPE